MKQDLTVQAKVGNFSLISLKMVQQKQRNTRRERRSFQLSSSEYPNGNNVSNRAFI